MIYVSPTMILVGKYNPGDSPERSLVSRLAARGRSEAFAPQARVPYRTA